MNLNLLSTVLAEHTDPKDDYSTEKKPGIQEERPARDFLCYLNKKGATQKIYMPLNLVEVMCT